MNFQKATAISLVAVSLLMVSGAAGQTEPSKAQLVNYLRFVNTSEHSYYKENGGYADQTQLVAWLANKNGPAKAIDLSAEKLKPYVLTVTVTGDGKHYQVNLQRPSDMSDKATWCKPAVFSDDGGLIFLASAIGCDSN